MRRQSWLKLSAVLVGIWSITAVAMLALRHQHQTAEKVVSYLDAHALTGLSAMERKEFLETLADKVNRLEFEERQKLRLERGLEKVFQEFTSEERLQFVEATMPQGFRQLMESLNQMTSEKRKRFVQKGLSDLQDAQSRMNPQQLEDAGVQLDEGALQVIIQDGFQSYLENASAETKLDLAPLLEQIQNNLQGLRQ